MGIKVVIKCVDPKIVKKAFNLTKGKEVKRPIITMSQNGSGIRDTARVLKISATKVMSELKKRV